ncbi:TonB-dependent receptor [Altererythrobacter sp. H2]|uniref:TonB-dependent receptor domain-containing protein n=1 Tax=Altererythrobacter sp. H2 TaxID=3108391 RepID=UPI002B4BA9CF|nr:TonB-dependent receptor [Altererythrobacter sp. H2]WRK95399.1 TonB-dependent receptor [Altererythrobacter sp. H2]
MKLQNQLKLAAAPVALSLALMAQPAFAQDAAAEEAAEEAAPAPAIVVTGSRISNSNLELSSPVSVVSSDDLELAQTNVAEEFLRELPSAVPSIGSAVNNGNGGASFVNLRGIGSNRNLVLLDGRRFTPADTTGRVDLNNIPLAIIERTEILTGGATTTYGADAIGGVVNFITKRDFAGVEATASQQITEQGDGSVFRADVTIGANFDDGRGNAVLSVGYQDQDAVFQGARDFSLFNVGSFSGAAGGSSAAVPSVIVGGGATGQINPEGTDVVPDTIYDFYNFNPSNIFQTPFKRYNIYSAAHYEVTDDVEVFTQAVFSKQTVSTIIAPGGSFFNTYAVPLSNPFIPNAILQRLCTGAGLDAAGCAAAASADGPNAAGYREVNIQVRRRSVEAGPRTSDFTTTLFNITGGLRGSLTDNVNWEVSGTYGESEQMQRQGGFARFSRLQNSLRSSSPDACDSGAEGCVPINLFGPAGTITQPMIDYVFSQQQLVITGAKLQQVQGIVNGDLGFGISDSPIGFAVGAEYRKYSATQQSDDASKTPGEVVGGGGAAPDINGSYDVKDAFGELVIPIIEDSIFRELTLELGARYSDYSTSGSEFTWKAGGTFSPVDAISIRGNYQRSSRAPNIGELFTPVTTGLDNLAVDPCAGAAPVGNTALRSACVAQIVRGGASQAQAEAFIGSILQPAAGQINVTGGGNPNLGVEKATTWTIGAVIEPMPNLSLTVDYFNIKLTDAITSPAISDVTDGCYDSPTADNPFCALISRNPTTGGLDGAPNEVLGLLLNLSNLGTIKTDGIDASLRYRTGLTDTIGFRFSTDATYTFKNEFEATPGSGFRDCVGLYSVNCASIQPKFVANTRATFTFNDVLDLSVAWRYMDGVNYEFGNAFSGTLPASVGPIAGQQVNFNEISAYNYFDLSARWAATENFEFLLTVQNLFDKDPPLVGSDIGSTAFNSGNTYPSSYDALGRRYAAAVKLRF